MNFSFKYRHLIENIKCWMKEILFQKYFFSFNYFSHEILINYFEK